MAQPKKQGLGLGLGLGLNAQQQQRVRQATNQGRLDQLMANRPGLGAKFQSVGTQGTANQQANLAALQQKSAARGAPQTGAGGAKGAGAPAPPTPAPANAPPKGGAAPAPAPAPAAAPVTFADAFDKALGAGASGQFGQMDWSGKNPIETARAAAQRGLDENLATIRNRYAQSGFGNSGRAALAEGVAAGDFATKFGDVAAERGLQDRQTSLDRLATMFSSAGAQDLQAQQLALQMNQQLMNAGTGLTGVGTSEQAIPGADLFTTLLTNMSNQRTYGQGSQKQPSK